MPVFFNIGNNKIEFKKEELSPEIQAENWKNIEAAIQREKEKPGWIRPMLVAASLLVVFASIIWLMQKYEKNNAYLSEVKTTFGEVKRITLPDSTIVVLNGNSVLKVPKVWNASKSRNVWIDGEAYFQVAKQKVTNNIFIVHTKEVDIEVLGTKFNVNTRNEQSTVALEEGKVQLLMKATEPAMPRKNKQPVIMKPGEIAVVNENDIIKLKADSSISIYSGWTRNEFYFNYTSLTHVAKMIQDTYGYTIEVSDSALWKTQLSGELRARNIQELVQVLEVILKRKIVIKEKTLLIR